MVGLTGQYKNYNLQLSPLYITPEQPWTFHELFLLSGDELTLIYCYWFSLIHSCWQQGDVSSWNESHIARPCNLYGRKSNFKNISVSSSADCAMQDTHLNSSHSQTVILHIFEAHKVPGLFFYLNWLAAFQQQ